MFDGAIAKISRKLSNAADKPVFTESGIIKLRNLLQSLEALQKAELEKYKENKTDENQIQTEKSEDNGEKEVVKKEKDSRQMLANVIEALILIIDNNSTLKLLDEGVTSKLFSLMDYVDGRTNSYTPCVFDNLSYAIAVLFKSQLEQFDKKVDLNTSVLFLLEQKVTGGVDAFYQTLLLCTENNLEKFQAISDSPELTEKFDSIKITIKGFFEPILQNIDTFCSEDYSEKIQAIVSSIRNNPELFISAHKLSGINQTESSYDPINRDRFQGSLLNTLLDYEIYLNKVLTENGKSTVHEVYDQVKPLIKFEEIDQYEQACEKVLKTLQNKLHNYNNKWQFLTSKNKNIDTRMKDLEKSLISKIAIAERKQRSWGSLLRDFELQVDKDIHQNNINAGQEGNSIADISVILAEARSNIIKLTSRISVANDADLAKKIAEHVCHEKEAESSLRISRNK